MLNLSAIARVRLAENERRRRAVLAAARYHGWAGRVWASRRANDGLLVAFDVDARTTMYAHDMRGGREFVAWARKKLAEDAEKRLGAPKEE